MAKPNLDLLDARFDCGCYQGVATSNLDLPILVLVSDTAIPKAGVIDRSD